MDGWVCVFGVRVRGVCYGWGVSIGMCVRGGVLGCVCKGVCVEGRRQGGGVRGAGVSVGGCGAAYLLWLRGGGGLGDNSELIMRS